MALGARVCAGQLQGSCTSPRAVHRQRMGRSTEVRNPNQLKGIVEPRARVELATCRLRIGCSTTELPRPLIINDLLRRLKPSQEIAIKMPSFALGFHRRVTQVFGQGFHGLIEKSDEVVCPEDAHFPTPKQSLVSRSAITQQIHKDGKSDCSPWTVPFASC